MAIKINDNYILNSKNVINGEFLEKKVTKNGVFPSRYKINFANNSIYIDNSKYTDEEFQLGIIEDLVRDRKRVIPQEKILLYNGKDFVRCENINYIRLIDNEWDDTRKYILICTTGRVENRDRFLETKLYPNDIADYIFEKLPGILNDSKDIVALDLLEKQYEKEEKNKQKVKKYY